MFFAATSDFEFDPGVLSSVRAEGHQFPSSISVHAFKSIVDAANEVRRLRKLGRFGYIMLRTQVVHWFGPDFVVTSTQRVMTSEHYELFLAMGEHGE